VPLCERTADVGRDVVANNGRDMMVGTVVETATVMGVVRRDGLGRGGEEGDEESGGSDHDVEGGKFSGEKKSGENLERSDDLRG